ncbi:MAG TPA: hypothetical protein PLR99_01780 [Polyangiaceae bacterium]|nr:hypothetical protein [Polyangiaceae bacterium]
METCPRCSTPLPAPGSPCPRCAEASAPVGETARQIVYEVDPESPAIALELDLQKKPAAVATAPTMATGTVERKRAKPTADPLEARLLGGFGLAPQKLWETPAYARRVKARTAELELAVAERRAAVERAEAALDDALIRMATRGAVAAGKAPRAARAPYERTIERLRTGAEQLKTFEGDRRAETEAQNERLIEIDRRAAEFKRELDLALNELRKLGERATPEDRRRADDARAKFAIATEGRDAIVSRLETAAPLSPKAAAVRKDYLLVCADFARFVMDDITTFGDDFDEARGEVIRLTAERENAQKALDLHRAALLTFDAEAVQRGNMLVIGGVVLAVLFFVGILARVVL